MLRIDTVHRAQVGAILSFGMPGIGQAFLGGWARTLWWGLLVPLLGNLVAAGLAYPLRLPVVVGHVIGSGPVTGPPVPRLLLVPGRPWVLAGKLVLGSTLPGESAVTGHLLLATSTAIGVSLVIRVLAARSAARLAYRQYWTLRRRALQQRLLAQLAARYDRDLLDGPQNVPSPNASYGVLRAADLLSVRKLAQALAAVGEAAHRAGDDALLHAVAAAPALVPPTPSTPVPAEAMHLDTIEARIGVGSAADVPPHGALSYQLPTDDTPPHRDETGDDVPQHTTRRPTTTESPSESPDEANDAAEPEDRTCPECGRDVTTELGFCPWCATKFEDGAE